MNSYVLSSVVPKAFKNRNPGLKSLHKFIYARVRIKTSNGCCKREWEWSGPLDLFTNNAPPPHSVDCFDSGPGIIDLPWQLTVWTLTEKNAEIWKFHSKWWKYEDQQYCAQSHFIKHLCKVQFCQKRVSFCATNSSLTVKCQCYPRGSNKSILIPPSVKKYVIFTINSLVRFAHSFVYLVKMTYFFPSVGIKKLLFSPLG